MREQVGIERGVVVLDVILARQSAEAREIARHAPTQRGWVHPYRWKLTEIFAGWPVTMLAISGCPSGLANGLKNRT